MRNGLVIPVDWERGTRMDLILPAPHYPLTQVGYSTVLAKYIKNECRMHVINGARELIPFFPLQVKHKPHDRMQIVCVFLVGCGCKQKVLIPLVLTA